MRQISFTVCVEGNLAMDENKWVHPDYPEGKCSCGQVLAGNTDSKMGYGDFYHDFCKQCERDVTGFDFPRFLIDGPGPWEDDKEEMAEAVCEAA